MLGPLRRACITGLVLTFVLASCSPGEGSGNVRGTINAADCWSGSFDLNPDFFAAVPFRSRGPDGTEQDSLQLRLQRGGDFQTFSDGVSILIDDLHKIRGSEEHPSQLSSPLSVGLAPGVTPPGVPIRSDPNAPIVHFALYLQRTCRTQNVALYGVEVARLGADGSCGAAAPTGPICAAGVFDGGTPDAGTPAEPLGRSTITFSHLFNGNPTETDAAERRITGQFRVYVADPREYCPTDPNFVPRCRGILDGEFDFYFERGRPAQPFP